VAALQAAADKLSPGIIRKRLDYWTFLLGPKFSAKGRKQVKLSRTYAISQVEYCFNFVFKRNFPVHKVFERNGHHVFRAYSLGTPDARVSPSLNGASRGQRERCGCGCRLSHGITIAW
jgi:hypothetical protein